MISIIIYVVIICCYLPGLYFIFKKNLAVRCPYISVFMLSSFIFVGLGAFYTISSMNITKAPILSTPYLIILMLQPLIFYAHYLIHPFNRFALIEWSKKKDFIISQRGHLRNIFILWGLSFCIIFHYIYNNGLPFGYDVHNWFVHDIKYIRQEATYVNRYWLIRDGFYNLPILATVYSFIVWLQYKRKLHFMILGISIVLTIIFSFSFLFKKYLFLFFATMFFSYFLFYRKITKRQVVYLLFTAFVVFVMFFYIYIPGQNIELYVKLILQRILRPYTEDLAIITKYMVETENYFNGNTIINPLNIFPFNTVNLSQFTMELKRNIYGNAPVPFLGEGFANFSYIGILIFWFIVFYSLFFLSFITKNIHDNLFCIYFIVFVTYSTYEVAFASIHRMISPVFFTKLAFVYFALYILSLSNKKRHRQNVLEK